MQDPLGLQQMPFVMGNDGTKGIAQTEMDERDKMKGDPDPPKVFCGRVTKDIIECVAFPLETTQHFFPVRHYSGGRNGFYRFHF